MDEYATITFHGNTLLTSYASNTAAIISPSSETTTFIGITSKIIDESESAKITTANNEPSTVAIEPTEIISSLFPILETTTIIVPPTKSFLIIDSTAETTMLIYPTTSREPTTEKSTVIEQTEISPDVHVLTISVTTTIIGSTTEGFLMGDPSVETTIMSPTTGSFVNSDPTAETTMVYPTAETTLVYPRAETVSVTEPTTGNNMHLNATAEPYPDCVNITNQACEGRENGVYFICYPRCQMGAFMSCSNEEPHVTDCKGATYGPPGSQNVQRTVFDPVTKKCQMSTPYCPRPLDKEIYTSK